MNTFTLGGQVSGLKPGSSMVLKNGTDSLSITGNGTFVFTKSLDDGEAYAVSVGKQPGNGQKAAITSGTGTVAGANVTNVVVTCS